MCTADTTLYCNRQMKSFFDTSPTKIVNIHYLTIIKNLTLQLFKNFQVKEHFDNLLLKS